MKDAIIEDVQCYQYIVINTMISQDQYFPALSMFVLYPIHNVSCKPNCVATACSSELESFRIDDRIIIHVLVLQI